MPNVWFSLSNKKNGSIYISFIFAEFFKLVFNILNKMLKVLIVYFVLQEVKCQNKWLGANNPQSIKFSIIKFVSQNVLHKCLCNIVSYEWPFCKYDCSLTQICNFKNCKKLDLAISYPLICLYSSFKVLQCNTR